MGTAAHLLRLVFQPDRFIVRVTEQIVADDRVKNPSVLLPGGEYPADRRAGIEQSVRGQTRSIRRALAKGLITTALTIAVGAVVGTALRHVLGQPHKIAVYLLQAVGAAVILGATLAEVGRDITTWGKESIPEQLNMLMFHGLYVLGTFLFVTSVAWDAT
jgi:hypothetical protein